MLQPRFLDSWVVERTLFEFVNAGGCSCCGMQHGGMRMEDFQKMCSDFETDDGRKEKKSPWPDFMRDDVWSERVKFRRLLKEGLPTYASRFPAGARETDFTRWFRSIDVKERARAFQMPKDELKLMLNNMGFKPAYNVVLCAVVEQVERYQDTGYVEDGASDAEVTFDECLYVERGAFVLNPEYYTEPDGIDLLLQRFSELGGPHLLAKRDEERRQRANDDGPVDEAAREDTQTFRSDRRLVRVCMARYFADVCWRKFQKAVPPQATS